MMNSPRSRILPGLSWQGVTFALASSLALLTSLAPAAQAQTGTLHFSASSYTVGEATAKLTITVSRVGGTAGTLSCDFFTEDGTAFDGEDYIGTNGIFTFGPGERTKTFSVGIINDTVHEATNTFTVVLLNLDNPEYLSDPANATVRITDNDSCAYTLSPASAAADEGGGVAEFTVNTTEGCPWMAESLADWIRILDHASGEGTNAVVYSYDGLPNNVNTRTGTIRVGGKNFTVTQTKPPVDLTPPTITFRTPAANSRQTNSGINVTGVAADGVGVTQVEFRLENTNGITPFADTEGLATWLAPVSGLVPGTNTILIRARDAAGNIGENRLSVVYAEVAPFGLVIEGLGTVTPYQNGQALDVGKSYTLTAKPAARYFFNGWSGSIESAENPLTFEMAFDTALQANFVLIPTVPLAGSYSGLFHEAEVTRHESSGFLTVKLAELGTFSATLQKGSKRYSFSGRFGLDGLATNTLAPAGVTPMQVSLVLDLLNNSDVISGTVSNGTRESTVQAFRATFKTTQPAPQAGRYTVLIPGEPTNSAAQPGGSSFGTVLVGKDGSAKFAGTLADGTKFTTKSGLSKDGWWPVYIPLYTGNGSIISLNLFSDETLSDLSGPFTWIKPAIATAKVYPAGFTVQPTLTGSYYRVPTNGVQSVLNFTAGTVDFTAGTLPGDFSTPVTLTFDGKVTDTGTNKLTLSITKTTGLFTGSVLPPGTTKRSSFLGAVHQKANEAAGFLLGTNQSAAVTVSEQLLNLRLGR